MKKLLIVLEILIFICCIVISTDSTDTMDSFWVCFPILNIVIMLPIVLIYSIFHTLKKKINNQQNKKLQTTKTITNKLSDKIFSKCKQEGTLNDIEDLKKLVNKNIKSNGTDAEFFDLNFIIAKIYNYLDNKEKTYDYFQKVEEIISHLGFKELCEIANKYLDKNRVWDAIYLYSCILEMNFLGNMQNIPDIYYNRAIAYIGLKQDYYTNFAIEDLNTAKEKAKYVYEMYDNISESYLTEKLDKYNLKLDEITTPKGNSTIDTTCVAEKNDVPLEIKEEKEEVVFDTEENKTIEPINCGIQAYEKACKLMNKKDYDSAIELFLTAFQYNVNTVDSLRNLAKAEKCLGNLQSAINYYKDVLKEEPNDAIAYNNIGNIYYLMKNYDEAFNAYSKAIEIDDNFDIAITNREKIIKMREKEQQKKADILYEQARKDFNYKDYANAKQNILKAIQIYNAPKYKTLEQKINKNIEKIESLYNDAILLKNTGTTVENYQTALKMLKKVTELNPTCANEYSLESDRITFYMKIQYLIDIGNITEAKRLLQKAISKYTNDIKIENFNKDIENLQQQAEDLYNKTLKYIDENNFEKAKNCIQTALKIDNLSKYKKLSEEIVVELNAEKYYKLYLKELDKQHYIEALSLINKALDIIPKKAIYKNALKEITPLVANIYFQDGQKFLEKQDYEQAIENFNKAITLDSTNLDYYEPLNIAIEENNKKQATLFYNNSINNMKNGKFELAVSNIQKALDIYPDNEIYQNILEKANNRMVDISTCYKGAVLTLDGFDKEKAEQFIQDRKIIKWYDIESFAKHFDLQPHEQILLADRLIFPLKPHIKQGRTVDL